MSKVGFKGFAKPKTFAADERKAYLENLPGDRYVLYTGGRYAARKASGRSASMATVKEVAKPVPLRTYAERAFELGFGTDISVGGLGLHQGAKPAVYLYLERDDKGNLVAVKDIPTPAYTDAAKNAGLKAPGKAGYEAGDIVVPVTKTKALTKA